MNVHVTMQLYNEIILYSTRSLPNEACGILLGESGTSQADELHVHTFIPLRNHAMHPTKQFVIDPLDMLPYLNDLSRTLVGLFHSHPTAAPVPSAEDLLTLWHSIPTYWILSLQHADNPDLQIYQLKKTITTTYHKLSFVIGQ